MLVVRSSLCGADNNTLVAWRTPPRADNGASSLRRLIIAFSFLTRLPMPRVESDSADFAAAIRYYPLVGLAIGGLIVAGYRGGALIDQWLGALAALVVWVFVTGALHLDGLGDLADATGAAHRDRERLIAVMADPHIGSFGVIAIVLQLLAKLVLLHALQGPAWAALLLVPAVARTGPLLWAIWLPPLKPGLGASGSRWYVAESRRYLKELRRLD